jgi:hypothetical protein
MQAQHDKGAFIVLTQGNSVALPSRGNTPDSHFQFEFPPEIGDRDRGFRGFR